MFFMYPKGTLSLRSGALSLTANLHYEVISVECSECLLRVEVVWKLIVTPAEAGVQKTRINKIKEIWMPASAGMTLNLFIY